MTSGPTSSIFCAHCGTRNRTDAFMCDRCGERVYRPNADQPPPLGLAACIKCNATNEAHAFYCVNCGYSMESAVRISPEGATSSGGAAEKPQARARVDNPQPQRQSRRVPEPRANIGSREAVQPTDGLPNSAGSAVENGSGVRGARLPESLKGFNWGAFLATPIWSLINQVWIGLLASIGLAAILLILRVPPLAAFPLQLLLALYFGFKGNEFAWQSRKWSSTTHFSDTQRTSLILGLAANVVLLVLLIFALQGAPDQTGP